MRYAETHKICGSVLVGACYSDLGDSSEKASGYYDTPWDWEAIKSNQRFILQYASPSDPYIPLAEARHIQKKLATKYFEIPGQGHFEDVEFPELPPAVLKAIKRHASAHQ